MKHKKTIYYNHSSTHGRISIPPEPLPPATILTILYGYTPDDATRVFWECKGCYADNPKSSVFVDYELIWS